MKLMVADERFKRGGYIDNEDAECKFVPEVNPREEGEERRDLDTFINDQYKYLEMKNLKQ